MKTKRCRWSNRTIRDNVLIIIFRFLIKCKAWVQTSVVKFLFCAGKLQRLIASMLNNNKTQTKVKRPKIFYLIAQNELIKLYIFNLQINNILIIELCVSFYPICSSGQYPVSSTVVVTIIIYFRTAPIIIIFSKKKTATQNDITKKKINTWTGNRDKLMNSEYLHHSPFPFAQMCNIVIICMQF